jgi:DNA-binding MarR family transcriptional regulator
MARQSKARQELSDEMSRVFRNYQRSVDSLDELASALIGVNRTDARVIDLLEQEGRLTAGQIAAGAGLTSGAVTGVVDRLERAGYARRVADEADRRKVLVEATEEVRRRALEIYYPLQPKGEKLMREYSDDELRRIIRFLEGVTKLTQEHTEELRRR